jgi:lipopolysaccharide assembly protein A
MRILVWLVRALLFFTLFAFALNNQQESAVRWFFGQEWRAPMVIIVLTAFALGCAFGVFAMVPSWWRQRSVARRHAGVADTELPAATAPTATEPALPQPPRDGL